MSKIVGLVETQGKVNTSDFLNLYLHQKLSKNSYAHKIANISLQKLTRGPYFLEFSESQP